MEEKDILYMGHVLVWHFAFVYYFFMNHKYEAQRLSKYICHIFCVN
jgi:GH35 family endo-1,4-beta-xylanase